LNDVDAAREAASTLAAEQRDALNVADASMVQLRDDAHDARAAAA
jgi:hypothetical protein